MIKLCTVRMSEGFIIFVHFNIDYYGLLESDTCSYVCTCGQLRLYICT